MFLENINQVHSFIPQISVLDTIIGIWDTAIKIIIIVIKEKKSLPSWNVYSSWCPSLYFFLSKIRSWVWMEILYLGVDVLEGIIAGNLIRDIKATSQ